MRVVLDLCDRCRSEMPLDNADGRLRLRLDLPTEKRPLRRAPEPPMLELCSACRSEFAGWMAEAGAQVPGLTPPPSKAAMPPVELPSADPPVPDEATNEEEQGTPETVVLSMGGAPVPGPGKGLLRRRAK